MSLIIFRYLQYLHKNYTIYCSVCVRVIFFIFSSFSAMILIAGYISYSIPIFLRVWLNSFWITLFLTSLSTYFSSTLGFNLPSGILWLPNITHIFLDNFPPYMSHIICLIVHCIIYSLFFSNSNAHIASPCNTWMGITA